MPRTIWEWLEIEETTDRSLIRKAYARQAAKYHPEEAPEEAQRLREAYKKALALADRKERSMDFSENIPADAGGEIPRIPPENNREVRQYDQQEKPGEPGQEPEAGSYRYGQRKQEKPGEPGQEPEAKSYRYGQRKQEKPEGPGQEPEAGSYRYGQRKQEKPWEPGQEPEAKSYRYVYQQDGGKAGGFGQPRQIDGKSAERTRRLGKRLVDLYESPAYRYSANLWSEAVKEYLTKEDLQDPLMVSVIISLLERMGKLDRRIWRVMERELFRYARGDAEWKQLREYFSHLCRLSGIRGRAEQNAPFSGNREDRTEEPGGTKIRGAIFRAAIAAVAVLMIHRGSRFREGQEQERRIQEMADSIRGEVLVTQSHTPGMEEDYDIDLNDDGHDDRIRYDDDRKCFIVEYYDPDTGEYVYQCTIDQYLEENPDKAGLEQILHFMDPAARE